MQGTYILRDSFCRFSPSSTDVALFDALAKAPDAAKYPNVARFYNHIASFSADQRKKFAAALGAAAGKAGAAAPAPAKADEDDVDLFGDDADAAAAAVKVDKPAAKEEPKKKEKKVVVQKTICVYDVKPLEAETEPSELEKAVRSIQMDGLQVRATPTSAVACPTTPPSSPLTLSYSLSCSGVRPSRWRRSDTASRSWSCSAWLRTRRCPWMSWRRRCWPSRTSSSPWTSCP